MVCNSTDEPAPSILKADTSWHKRSKHRDWTKLFYEKAMWIYFLNFTSFEIMVVKEDLCKILFWVIVWFNYLSTWSKVSLLSLRFICKPIFVFVWQAVIIWVFIKYVLVLWKQNFMCQGKTWNCEDRHSNIVDLFFHFCVTFVWNMTSFVINFLWYNKKIRN